jgi:hypothetical protein
MLTVKGTYKDGKVELSEHPDITQSQVLVTFLETNEVDLSSRGMNETQAADLRARLKIFAEDWERPEASVYDEDRQSRSLTVLQPGVSNTLKITQMEAFEELQKHLDLDAKKAAAWMAAASDARR